MSVNCDSSNNKKFLVNVIINLFLIVIFNRKYKYSSNTYCHQSSQFLVHGFENKRNVFWNVFWKLRFKSMCEAVMYIHSHNLCFSHETKKQKHF